jgi:glucose-6-phosphate dehydrogenase assembly protein OpcA
MSTLATEVLGQEVPVSRVNAALRELWAADDTSKTRASLMNFVIYSQVSSGLDVNTAALAEITREHACRAMLLLAAPGTTGDSRAWVTAHCQLYDGKRSVCCEQLSFLLPSATADSVANVIFSHVESDLPLVVWWQGELGSVFEERFYSVMDGLIIDSCGWQDAKAGFAQLRGALQGKTTRFVLADLAWMRSHTLRTALATACQDSRVLAALPEVSLLRISHAPGARVTALLFAAWVGTQLGCTTAGSSLQLLRGEGSDIRVELTESAGSCSLEQVELSGPGVSVALRREPGSKFVRALLQQGDYRREDLVPADFQTDAELITDQLSRLGGTSRYLEVLPLLQHWV